MRSREEVERLVVDHAWIAASFSKRYRKSAERHRVEHDDIIQAGLVGLTIAAQRFDQNAGAMFKTYAYYWVRNEILELISRAASRGLGGARDHWKRGIGSPIVHRLPDNVHELLPDPNEPPSEKMERDDLISAVTELLEGANKRQAFAFRRRYFDGVPVPVIAEEMGVSISTVSLDSRHVRRQLAEALA